MGRTPRGESMDHRARTPLPWPVRARVAEAGNDDPARRFIAVVDEFYDRGVKLLAAAAAVPAQLYAGTALSFAFQRTVSRLIEMQSAEYLARPHRVELN